MCTFQTTVLSWKSSGRCWWTRGLRCGSAATRLLGLRVRIPWESRMSVCCECSVLSSRGLCIGLITRPGRSYRVWCGCVCVCVCVCVILKPQWEEAVALAPWEKWKTCCNSILLVMIWYLFNRSWVGTWWRHYPTYIQPDNTQLTQTEKFW